MMIIQILLVDNGINYNVNLIGERNSYDNDDCSVK